MDVAQALAEFESLRNEMATTNVTHRLKIGVLKGWVSKFTEILVSLKPVLEAHAAEQAAMAKMLEKVKVKIQE